MNKAILCIAIAGLAVRSVGQIAPAQAFEVASIRPHEGPMQVMMGFSSSGPRVTMECYNIRALIMEAYNLKNYQVSVAFAETQQNVFYDIAAKAEGEGALTRGQFRPLLQNLLAERFHLKVHHEMKEMPVYALVVGKNGPKFSEGAPDASFVIFHGVHGRNQTIVGANVSMESFAEDLADNFSDRPVIDRTGLSKNYGIKFEATPEYRAGNPQPEDISAFAGVQELGLKLEPVKAPIDILVIDHIENPSAN